MPRLAVLVVGLLLMASSCQSDPSVLEEALDPGTAVPTQGPLSTSSAMPLATATPTGVSTEVPIPTEVSNPTEGLGGSVHYIPSVAAPIPGDSRLEGQPFAPSGAMPAAIIATTEECDIVAIDSRTGETVVLWDYSRSDSRSLDCSDQGSEYREYAGTDEIAPGYIEDVEWADSKYVLISMCCEPGAGRFEVLDIEEHDQPIWLALNGYSPWVDSQSTFLFSTSGVGDAIVSFGTISFQVRYDSSDPKYPYYWLLGDVFYHHLVLEEGGSSSLRWSVGRSSWVGGDDIVVGFWTILSGLGWYPWVAKISPGGGAAASNARGSGWMLPTGDRLGNLVVAEQECLPYLAECIGLSAKVVVVDSETLAPVYEVEVEDPIVDMDLERGWLLVTLVDGRMGNLDLADGSFSVLADGIRNAVWQE